MKHTRYKGFSVFIVALIICSTLLYRISGDRYSVSFFQSDFRQVYLNDYSTSPHLLEYLAPCENAVKGFVKGPLNLESGDYSLELQYAATQETSELIVFAPDYISSDNSGGKIFVKQAIDPSKSALVINFSLDQKIDSLFVTLQTKDTGFTIGRIYLSSSHAIDFDTYFYCILTFLSALAIFWLLNAKWTKVQPLMLQQGQLSPRKTAMTFVFVMGVAVFIASIPLINDGLLPNHDLYFHMARIEGIARGLESGQFPVRIHGGTLNDYGYPNSLMYPELLLYFPATLRVMGMSLVSAYKLYVIGINLITLLVAYFSFQKLTSSRLLGLTMGVLYLFNPYRLICLYYRGATGEFTAIAFLPLVFYGLYAILWGKKKDWVYLVVGATGVLQSHILTTELTVIFVAIFVIGSIKNLFTHEKRFLPLLYATGLTGLLNLWFIGPMLMMITQLGLSVFSRTQSPYGMANLDITYIFGTSALTDIGPHPIGWVSFFALGFYVLHRISHSKSSENALLCKLGDKLAALSVVLIVATTAYFPWEIIERIPVVGEIISSIQFPYRLLSLAQLCMVLLVGFSIMLWLPTKRSQALACAAAVCLAVVSTSLFYETAVMPKLSDTLRNRHYYSTNLDNSLSVGQAEYLVEGSDLNDIVGKIPLLESDNQSFAVSQLARYGTNTQFQYTMDFSQGHENVIILPITYIPNYKIQVDGVNVAPMKYAGGRVAFTAPTPQGSVTVAYSAPLTFRFFELISSITLLCFILRKRLWTILGFIFKRSGT